MDIYDVIIIGGGAAGCMAAISAAKTARNAKAVKKILIIEKNEKLVKKIYATGNGKCNFTNDVQMMECYRSECSKRAWEIVSSFNKDRTIAFFKEMGIFPKNKNGYYYPYSEQASSVAEAFLLEIKKYGIKTVCGAYVERVERYIDGKSDFFCIYTDDGEYYGQAVIIAAGGMASPVHGSDGSGYKIANELGHKLIKPLPALTQLKGRSLYLKTAAGVRIEGIGYLYIDDLMVTSEQGEFLFTIYGISGIPVLQMSRFAAKAIDEGKGVCLKLDFFPDFSEEEFCSYLTDKYRDEGHKTIEEVLHGIINNKLAYAVLREIKLEPRILAKKVNREDIRRLSAALKNIVIDIIETNGFENAQASSGGVSLMEINVDIMESLIVSRVYFAGEILDVDGTCGGYNLQWAFSSGYLAGKAAVER